MFAGPDFGQRFHVHFVRDWGAGLFPSRKEAEEAAEDWLDHARHLGLEARLSVYMAMGHPGQYWGELSWSRGGRAFRAVLLGGGRAAVVRCVKTRTGSIHKAEVQETPALF